MQRVVVAGWDGLWLDVEIRPQTVNQQFDGFCTFRVLRITERKDNFLWTE